jgi:hypothetical protein
MCVGMYGVQKEETSIWVPNLPEANSPLDNSKRNGKTSVGQIVTITAACSD